MNLRCSTELAATYKSGSQIARVLTEAWCARELYCPACTSNQLSSSKVNTPVVDFTCPLCDQLFQLKSLRGWNGKRIPDAGYDSMQRSIRADKVPNLLVLQYSSEWFVRNLLIVPHFFFSESIIEKRKPLAAAARRAGWVGCNILLGQIPIDGRIAIVADGVPAPAVEVRSEFARASDLAEIPPSEVGRSTFLRSSAASIRQRSSSAMSTNLRPKFKPGILPTGTSGRKSANNFRFSGIWV